MTQPPRTTESLSRDHEAIREIMHEIQDRLTVPDRATLALGLVGHLATFMNPRQMDKLLGELTEQAERLQGVPLTRRGDREDGERISQERRERTVRDSRARASEPLR